MINKIGTHGTSVTNAKCIEKDGFNLSDGRRGRGIYLWEDGPYAIDLARDWHSQQLSACHYAGQEDMRCAIITVMLQIERHSFLDCSCGEYHRKLTEHIRRVQSAIPSGKGKRRKFLVKTLNHFIGYVEKANGVALKVAAFVVPAPSPTRYPVDLLGHPVCYVVRNRECITGLTFSWSK